MADVPILIEGKRKNGTVYRIKSHMKIEKLGLRPVEVPLNLNHDQRVALAKRLVLSSIRSQETLMEMSDEKWQYDPDGSWRVNEETVGVDPETHVPESRVILDRRTRAVPKLSSTMLFQEASARKPSRSTTTTSALLVRSARSSRGTWAGSARS